jgi:beta-fructofuranosidase
MVLGARLDNGDGAALQYHSADLRTWTYDGILVERDSEATEGVWTDSMWECPQLFELDGTWVLIVSTEYDVAYALGHYDGRTFTPRTWGEFGRGGRMYATTTFLDAEGRRCAMSWLRERDDKAPPGSPWAGALSLPWVLSVRGDRLLAGPHPHLDHYLTDGGDTALRVDGGRLFDGDEPLLDLPPGGEVTVIVDADLVEVAVEGVSGLGAARRRVAGESPARILRFAASMPGNAASRPENTVGADAPAAPLRSP